jgi:nicotinamide mononucleotide transporter
VETVLTALKAPALGSITWAELWGDASGLLCVWLVARQHLWNWPIGLVNNAFFFIVFWSSKLYGDAVLQLVFAAIGCYGWWCWVRSRGVVAGTLPVRRTTPREWVSLSVSTFLATGVAAWWLSRHTDSPVPLWDASVLTLSLAATYGQARKLVESWWLWIAVDLLSIPLYLVRGLYPTALLYALFLALCFVGLRAWRRELFAARSPALERA